MVKKAGILLSVFSFLWCVPLGAATINVTTLADEQNMNGQCSLREAMVNANHDNRSGSFDCLAGSGDDTIVFNDNLNGTITLGSPLPPISQNLTIKGGANRTVEISGNNAVRVFEISPGLIVRLQDLVIAKGCNTNGGGVRITGGVLNIDHCRFTDNFVRNHTYGGGLHNWEGTVNIKDSEFSKNRADMGGGIYSNGIVNITNCTFQDNEARIGSGIRNTGKADIADSEFKSNKIEQSGGGISNTGDLVFRNSTISDHATATGQGGGFSNAGKAELDGVTVKNNRAGLGGGIYNTGTLKLSATTVDGNRAVCSGGGIFNSENGQLNLTGEKGACKITHNTATNNGGGIYSYNATTMISDSEISGNSTEEQDAQGGGIYSYGGRLEIHGVALSSNIADEGGGLFSTDNTLLYNVSFRGNNAYRGSGGGAFVSGERTRMEDVVFDKNEAEKDGGGIYNGGTLFLTKGAFSDNKTRAGLGGGIYNGGTADSQFSSFSRNQAMLDGGGIYNDGPLKVTGCTVHLNWAAGNGGGISNRYSNEAEKEFRIVNSTLSGNWADSKGGGIYNEGSEVTVVSSTLSGNEVPGQRSNIVNQGGVVKLQNTLIAGDMPGDNCTGSCTSLGYNLSSDTSCGLTQTGDLANAAPLLAPLADNGGFTWTHALQSGSPAMDKIPKNTNGCGGSINTDQRGTARPQPTLGKCDIGSYEVKKPSLHRKPVPFHH